MSISYLLNMNSLLSEGNLHGHVDPQIHHTSLQVFVKRMTSLSYDHLHVVYEVVLFLCLPV